MPEQAAVHELLSQKHGPGDLRVVKFRGTEAMSRLFRFDVVVRAVGAVAEDVPRSLVGQRVTLSIGGLTTRVVRGVVSEAEEIGIYEQAIGAEGVERAHRVRIVPHFAFLKHTQKSRVFQDQSVPTIVGAVLSGAHVAHELRLSGRYLPRVYCVQYQESDFAFVERLLAEEGIFYWFEHEAQTDREVLVMSDAPEGLRPIEGDVLHHRERGAGQAPEDDLLSFSAKTRVRTGRVEVRHWDFLRPGFREPGVATETGRDIDFDERTLEVYEHQAELDEYDASTSAARVRLEELRAKRRLAQGESRSRRPIPGRVFQLKSEIHREAEGLYSIVRIEHEGQNPEATRLGDATDVYKNRITASPAEHPVRPRRKARRVQQSMETATVVGPAGREIHTDEHGRIRVRFHWDRDPAGEEASCWIRTMQAWSGPGWGTQLIPRIGMEVVVLFVGGDVDRPLVIGCVPNITQPMPFQLPRHKTKSGIKTQSTPSGGRAHNELSFEDRTGYEQIYIHAEKDMHVDVNHDLLETVHHDATRKVDKNSHVVVAEQSLVSVGGDDTHAVGGNRRVLTERDVTTRIEGSEQHVVGGDVSVQVSGELTTTIGGGHRHQVGGEMSVQTPDALLIAQSTIVAMAGTEDTPGTIVANALGSVSISASEEASITADGEILLQCGDSAIVIGPSSIQLRSPQIILSADGASAHLGDDKAIVLADSNVCLKSDDKIGLFSSGAHVVLGSDAKIDGSAVKLKAAASPGDDPTTDSEEPTTIELVDEDGNPVPNARYKLYLSGGRILAGTTNGEGKAEVRFSGDANIVFPDLGQVERQ